MTQGVAVPEHLELTAVFLTDVQEGTLALHSHSPNMTEPMSDED